MKKPKILAIRTDWNGNQDRHNEDGYGGVSYYRIIKPLEAVKDDFDITILGKGLEKFGKTPEEVWSKLIPEYDLIYIKHVDNAKAISALLAFCDHYKKPIIMDFDDNYLDVQPDQPAYEFYYPGSQKLAVIGASMALVNGIIVSTEPLKEKYSQHIKENHNIDKKIDIMPNFNDLKDWRFSVKRWNDDKIRIGYAGSTTHNQDLEVVIPSIVRILKKYPYVVFEIMGSIAREDKEDFLNKFGDVKDRVTVLYGTPSWQGYPELLCKKGWDIGLAPLADNIFTRGKSHIKWMEYTMAGIPVIASDVYPYVTDIGNNKVIEHGETGLISGEDDWFTNIELLVLSKGMRKRLQTNAYNYIADNWQWSQHKDKLVKILNSYIK